MLKYLDIHKIYIMGWIVTQFLTFFDILSPINASQHKHFRTVVTKYLILPPPKALTWSMDDLLKALFLLFVEFNLWIVYEPFSIKTNESETRSEKLTICLKHVHFDEDYYRSGGARAETVTRRFPLDPIQREGWNTRSDGSETSQGSNSGNFLECCEDVFASGIGYGSGFRIVRRSRFDWYVTLKINSLF